MNLFFGAERRAALRIPFAAMLYLVAALELGAQAINPGSPGSAAKVPGSTTQGPSPAGKAPGTATQAPGPAPQAANPASQAPVPAEQIPSSMLVFNIRSAFSLSPAMVKQLRGKEEDQGSRQLEKPGEEASRAQAAPVAPGIPGGVSIAWTESLARSLPVAAPLDLRLMGKNLIVILQILPIAVRDPIVDLFVHGQIWLTTQDNSISYNTTMQSVSIPLGSRIYFYPLGADLKTGAPVAVEIKVDRTSLR